LSANPLVIPAYLKAAYDDSPEVREKVRLMGFDGVVILADIPSHCTPSKLAVGDRVRLRADVVETFADPWRKYGREGRLATVTKTQAGFPRVRVTFDTIAAVPKRIYMFQLWIDPVNLEKVDG
jgi:hypothetical protein